MADKNDIKIIIKESPIHGLGVFARQDIVAGETLERCAYIVIDDDDLQEKDLKDLDNICDECKNKHESVSQNLILTGFKICKSCRVSKTIFPI